MAKQDTEQEPSIEEILSSIRQIISDDDDGKPASSAESETAEPVIHEDLDEDVIELTQRVEDEPESFSQMVDDFASEPEPPAIVVAMRDAEIDAPADFSEAEEVIPQSEVVAPPPPPPRPAPVARAAEEEDSILTRQAEDAAYSGFSELARRTAIEHGGITLEEIVRSELKPMLRDWLDRNLPPIIERLVSEELERVAKRALED